VLACNRSALDPFRLPYLGDADDLHLSRPSDPLHRLTGTCRARCTRARAPFCLVLYSTFPCTSQSTQPAASVALAVVVPSHLHYKAMLLKNVGHLLVDLLMSIDVKLSDALLGRHALGV
jgi:hypothetical protein